ncbi:MAG: response regulator transcription factor [Granulosicoccus sp.]
MVPVNVENSTQVAIKRRYATGILNRSWVGLLFEGPSGKVLLFARQTTDAAVVSGFLAECGYVRNASSMPVSRGHKRLHGLIICHREGSDSAAENILRSAQSDRVVVLSDCSDEQTIVSMLGHGAHHYFSINDSRQVLVARLAASLRQHEQATARNLVLNDIRFDTRKRKVFREGDRISLSPKEYELAHYLFRNVDRLVTNEQLMCSVWSLPSGLDSRRIDTAACRVRKKMSLFPDSGWELKRIRTIGYKLLRLSPDHNLVIREV